MSAKGFEGSSNDTVFDVSCVFSWTREVHRCLVFFFLVTHPCISPKVGFTDFSKNFGDFFHISYHPCTFTYI